MNDFNSYIKFLSRNKLYTFINVLGLSVSLMFVIIIANYTVNELTIDRFQKNADNIYVLGSEGMSHTAYRVGGRLKSRYPEIEKICGVASLNKFEVEVGNVKIQGEVIAVDTTFFDMFSFKLRQGDRNHVLASKNSVVISERFAKKAFGGLDPIGQSIKMNDSLLCNVSGVVEDFDNSILPYTDMIIHIESLNHFGEMIGSFIDEGMGNASGTTLFLQTVKGANITSKTDDMLEYFKTFFWVYKNGARKTVTLTPMKEMYFSESRSHNIKSGDKTFTTMLLVVGIIILVFAVLNYINLTVAQTGFRAKEVSMRRLLGASKQAVFVKMIFESMLLCGVAFLIGSFLALAVEPYVNDLIGGEISIIGDISLMWVSTYIGLIFIIGVITGLFPAVVISRFKPIDVVRGSFTFKSKMVYSKIFITVQAMITIILIACSITVLKQVEHLINADLGYNQKGIITVDTWRGAFKDKNHMEQFRERLKALPIVKNVGFTEGMPIGGGDWTMNVEGVDEAISFQYRTSDSATMKIFGFEILKDNQVAEDGYWLNETAMRIIGANENTKSFKHEDGREFIIKGVVKDYMLGDLVTQDKQLPLMLDITENVTPWDILVEVDGGLVISFREVESVFKEVTNGAKFDAKFLDQQIAERYESQKKTSTIMMIFTFIALVISSLGLLAMSAYFIQQRSLEIAIRKVFGSTTPQVLKKLVWQFLRLVVVAFVIACPIIWYAMSEWLKEFSYRIDLSVWIFVMAGIFTLSISFLTVFWQSSIAANTNPVDSIKK